MLHPKWHLVRAYYLVVECRLSVQEVGSILGHCRGGAWPDKPYHPDTVKNYVRRGSVEVKYFKGPLWRLSSAARSFLTRAEGIDLTDDAAITQVHGFVDSYRVGTRPRGCGAKIWKEIVDAIE